METGGLATMQSLDREIVNLCSSQNGTTEFTTNQTEHEGYEIIPSIGAGPND